MKNLETMTNDKEGRRSSLLCFRTAETFKIKVCAAITKAQIAKFIPKKDLSTVN
jgi:hypothetical protein